MIFAMYFNDHAPPHFHIKAGAYRAAIAIANGELLDGALPPRLLRLATAWAQAHRQELSANWRQVSLTGLITKISPEF